MDHKRILKSIDKKNKIYRKCIRTKNATKKGKLAKWQWIKEIIDISKKNTQNIQNINDNGKLITSHKKIANTFNKFFCDIPKQIENKIVGTHKNYQDYLITCPTNTEEAGS